MYRIAMNLFFGIIVDNRILRAFKLLFKNIYAMMKLIFVIARVR